MPADRWSSPSSTSRSRGTNASPAQMRRRRSAREAAAASDSPSSQPRTATVSSRRPPTRSRDRILGYGAAVGALLGLISPNISSLVTVIALGYTATALLGPAEKRDRRLRLAGWITGAMALLMATMAAVVLGLEALHPAENDASLLAYLPLGGATLILSIASSVALASAAIYAALGFGREGEARYLTLGRAALCVLVYFILLLPSVAVSVPAPGSIGSFWQAPMAYAIWLLDFFAAAAVACAFLWAAESDKTKGCSATRFTLAHREYLFLVAAVSLALAHLLSLLAFDWTTLQGPADATPTAILAARAAYVARRLLPLELAVAAGVAFWVSCRQAGWTPKQWSDATSPGRSADELDRGPQDDTLAGGEAAGEHRSPSLSWAMGLFLTWRLPLLYGWLIALVAACSFLRWYGLLLVLPAAAHYLWMRAYAHRRIRMAAVSSTDGP